MPLVEPTAAPKPRAGYWIASLALAGVLLYFSLRGIDWPRVWAIFRGASLPIVLATAAVMSIALFLRSYRWRVLLNAEGNLPIPLAFWATAAGYLGNNLLPARAGEVVRTLMVSRSSGMSRTFVLTTAMSERVVDAIALIVISTTVLLGLPERPGWLADATRPFAILGLCGVATIALFPILERFWFRLLSSFPLPPKLKDRVLYMLEQGVRGIRTFHDGSRLGRFLLFTGVIWCLDAAITVVGAQAIGITITMPVAFLLVAALGLGSALPSTPGYVGIYQFVAVSILTPFGLSRTDAIAYIFLFQAINYAVVLLWGLIGIGRHREAAVPQAA